MKKIKKERERDPDPDPGPNPGRGPDPSFEELMTDRLECLTVEINKPHSRPFLVSTWYRPPNSPPDLFDDFENLISKIDGSNRELYLVGDMNTNLLPGVADSNSSKLINVCEIFVLSQLITEPTRVTALFSP